MPSGSSWGAAAAGCTVRLNVVSFVALKFAAGGDWTLIGDLCRRGELLLLRCLDKEAEDDPLPLVGENGGVVT